MVDHTPSGADIDIIREAFKRLPQYRLDEYIIPLARAAREYPQGKIDSLYIFKSPIYDKFSLYTKTPIRWVQFKLAVMAGSDLNYTDMSSLKDKNIGMIAGVPIRGAIKKAVDSKYLDRVSLIDYPNLLRMLKRNRLDAILGSKPSLMRIAKQMNVDIRFLDASPEPIKGYFPAISLRSPLKNKTHLQLELSRVLGEMQTDGSYEKIFSRYNISKDEYWPEPGK